MKKMFSFLMAAAFLFTAIAALPARSAWAYEDEPVELSPDNIDAAVRQIRGWYNDPAEWDAYIAIKAGENGWEYNQEYSYHHGVLYFAYLHLDEKEYRFYFLDNTLIRVIDANGDTWDYPDIVYFDDFEARIMESAYAAYYGPDWFDNPVFEGEDGWDGEDDLEEENESLLFQGDYMPDGDRAVRYDSPGADFHFVLIEYPLDESFFVVRLDETGESLEGYSKAWKQEDNTWYFVGGMEEDHTYLALTFSDDGSSLIYSDGLHPGETFYAYPEFDDSDLIAMANLYYQSQHGGMAPDIIDVDGEDEDGNVLLHLYQDVPEPSGDHHTATLDWYTVNPVTLEAEDILGNNFFLNIIE